MTFVRNGSDSLRRRPLRTIALFLVAVITFVVVREFAGGFLDGLIAGFTDDR